MLGRVKRCLRIGFHHAAGLRCYDFRSRSSGNTGAHGLNLLGRQVSLCVSSARHRFQRTSLGFWNRGAGQWLRRWRNPRWLGQNLASRQICRQYSFLPCSALSHGDLDQQDFSLHGTSHFRAAHFFQQRRRSGAAGFILGLDVGPAGGRLRGTRLYCCCIRFGFFEFRAISMGAIRGFCFHPGAACLLLTLGRFKRFAKPPVKPRFSLGRMARRSGRSGAYGGLGLRQRN